MLYKHLFIITLVLIVFSCKNDAEKNDRYLPPSGGTTNTLTIVSEDKLWEGEVGDATRAVFAASVYGLTQDEPLFTLRQMKPRAFHEYVKKSRTFVELKKGAPKGIKFVKDVYATPQLGIIISGENNEALKAVLKENATAMTDKIKSVEIAHKIKEISKNPLENDAISELFDVDLTVLFSYRIAKKTDNFMWLRKDIKNGDMNLMIYEVPYGTIKNDSTAIQRIVKLRDSIGEKYIAGPVKNSYMVTEKAFTPYLGTTTINNKYTLETRGIWDVKNDYMAGPFITYVIDDKQHNRQLVLEGFTYAPQISKRDYMFELESIIRSVVVE